MHAMTRRTFFAAAAGTAAGMTATRLRAIEPFKRPGKGRLKLALAAYSMKKYLEAAPGTKGAMDMGGFIDYCASLPVDGAELTSYWFPKEVTGEYLAGLKRRAHLAGIDVSGGAIRNNFTQPPGEAADREHAQVRTWVDRYAELGAPVVRVFAGAPPAGVSEDQAVENCIAHLERACDYAGKRGIFLGLESHDFSADVERILTIVRGVQSPWFGVLLDSGNFRSADPYADVAKVAPYAVATHVKAGVRRAGAKAPEPADFRRITGILKDAGYSGYVTLEYEEKADPYEQVPRCLEQIRACL